MKDESQPIFSQELFTSRPWSKQKAQQVLEQQRQSGQDLAEFARSVGLQPRRLRQWKKRLEPSQPRQFLPVVVHDPHTTESFNLEAGLVVRIGHAVCVDIHRADAATASWVAQLVADCRNGVSS